MTCVSKNLFLHRNPFFCVKNFHLNPSLQRCHHRLLSIQQQREKQFFFTSRRRRRTRRTETFKYGRLITPMQNLRRSAFFPRQQRDVGLYALQKRGFSTQLQKRRKSAFLSPFFGGKIHIRRREVCVFLCICDKREIHPSPQHRETKKRVTRMRRSEVSSAAMQRARRRRE